MEDLGPAGGTADLRIASFLRRDGESHAYGIDSPVVGYSYFGDVLLDWMVERLHHQNGSPETPLENVGQYLLDAGSPATVVIGIGATRYTEVGESTYLSDGDDAIVIVYDASASTPEQVAAAVAAAPRTRSPARRCCARPSAPPDPPLVAEPRAMPRGTGTSSRRSARWW